MPHEPAAVSPEDRATEQLAHRLASVGDREARFTYARHILRQMSHPTVAGILAAVTGRIELRDGAHLELLLILTVTLVTEPDLRAGVLQAAADRGLTEVLRWFGASAAGSSDSDSRTGADAIRPGPSPKRGGAPSPGRQRPGQQGPEGVRPLTLGERKSLARTHDRSLLQRALSDRHPAVIGVSLRNGHLTVDDVVRLCAKRPMPREVLHEVLLSTRWIVQYRVIRTIVLNPYTPPDTAVPLSVQLTEPDARIVRDSPQLPVSLREACRRDSLRPPLVH